MMRLILFLLSILFWSIGWGQEISGIVRNSDGQKLSFSVVLVGKRDTLITDGGGRFKTIANHGDSIVVRHNGYEPGLFIVDSNERKLICSLFNHTQEIEAITVSAGKEKKEIDEWSTNVIDYRVYDNVIIALKKRHNNKYLSFVQWGRTIKEFLIDDPKVHRLYEDCLGNLHLLSTKKAYQVYFNPEMQYVDTLLIEDFNSTVASCIGAIDSVQFFERYHNHNKLYVLYSHDGEKERAFYYKEDILEEKQAKYYYNLIISMYYQAVPIEVNIIELGIWDGRLFRLGETIEIIHLISWYEQIVGAPIEMESFTTNDEIVVANIEDDEVKIFNPLGYQTSSLSYDFNGKGKTKMILHDRKKHDFSELNWHNGSLRVNSIKNERQSVNIGSSKIVKNIQLFNGWAYYLKKENGYYDLCKMKMD